MNLGARILPSNFTHAVQKIHKGSKVWSGIIGPRNKNAVVDVFLINNFTAVLTL